tara:strand:+ start:225 stop:1076 length:852 start_codon:yes stop_codon:yes gene_type:complete
MTKDIKKIFYESPYKSTKHDSYFHTYQKIFSRFVDQKITFVEVGILGGGSLFMWREYFGKNARIIGIDNNPDAKIWEDHGFEIYIGDQANNEFWNNFKSKVGMVDILLDDGGHTDLQQSTTLFEFANNIRDGGLLVTEDTHASYLKDFGNPSKYSFINLSFNLVDRLNFRSGVLEKLNEKSLDLPISEIRYFESIVVFEIDRRLKSISKQIDNNGKELNIKDFRHKNTDREKIDKTYRQFSFIKKIPIIGKIFERVMTGIIRKLLYQIVINKSKKDIKKYLKK